MVVLYVLTAVVAVITAALGLLPIALICCALGVATAFAYELRTGLQKIRRPVPLKPAPEKI